MFAADACLRGPRLVVLALCSFAAACGADSEPAPDPHAGACPPALPELSSARVDLQSTIVRDELNRQVYLRGVNAGGRAKLPPFFPFPFAESGDPLQSGAPPFDQAVAAYADRVASWGHDVVRLPFTWEAVEPVRGTYDDQFLSRYEAMARAFGDRQIRVIVDFHQDVFARPFCGDGFPLWAVLDPIEEKERNCHQWFQGYLTVGGEVQVAFDHFWANDDGLRDAFGAMWQHVATRLWTVDAVIGFEIINEPGWGTHTQQEFATAILPQFYSELATKIREVAPGAPVFFDSTGVDAVAAQTSLVRPDGEDLFFAPHFYDGLAVLSGIWTGDTKFLEGLGRWRAKGEEWGVPVLVGEFGIRATADGGAQYMRLNYDAMDQNLLHGTQWEYSTTEDDWNDEGMSVVTPQGEDSPLLQELLRAYPAAVGGLVTSFAFDREARTGTLVFSVDAGAAESVTEIAAPARLYPEGVSATIEGAEGCSAWLPGSHRLAVRLLSPTEGATVTISFGPGTAKDPS